jgi:hypothetical protein
VLVVAKRFNDSAAEVVDAAVDVNEQRLAHPRVVTHRGKRTDQRRADEIADLFLERRQELRDQGAVGVTLEVGIRDFSQAIVRRSQPFPHLIRCSRIVEASEQDQTPEANEAILMLMDRLEQRGHRL